MTSGLEDLSEYIFGDSRVQATDVQCSLVRLGSSSCDFAAGWSSGGHLLWNILVVLRYDNRR